jgi:K+-transporting ATPase KdpF subunit
MSPLAIAWHKAPAGEAMTLDYVIGLLITVGLLVYLTYALLRPEKF